MELIYQYLKTVLDLLWLNISKLTDTFGLESLGSSLLGASQILLDGE